ncbi:hypothetical protein GSS88_08315 [Corynebacterium sp. 3HC-13]|uniref:hypothetical protein n=1 Tax=Corynebacterium poyangense TaxID=2684405 RepID=UPI001CC9699C|nr:hypothetical protein [Corynebacterium poyangense]MBZ8177793.1 hypothetical protein [Corynebacterium poyangense]
MSVAGIRRRRRYLAPLVLFAACGLAMSGCQHQAAQELSGKMGNATAVESPPNPHPSGEVLPLPEELKEVHAMDYAENVLAVQGPHHVGIGTVEQFRQNDAVILPLDNSCGTLRGSSDHQVWTLGCGNSVWSINPQEPNRVDKMPVEHSTTTAVQLSDGTIATGSNDSQDLWLYQRGQKARKISMDGSADSLVAVTVPGHSDALVRVNRQETTIQDVHFADNAQGGTLRVGLGVGQVAAGEKGLLLASDTTGNRLMIYTGDDVIRLHQSYPVDASPWAVAWDKSRNLAWIGSTSANSAVGYDIRTGVPVAKAHISTLPDSRSLVVLDDGTVVAASASGHGLQVIHQPQPADQ